MFAQSIIYISLFIYIFGMRNQKMQNLRNNPKLLVQARFCVLFHSKAWIMSAQKKVDGKTSEEDKLFPSGD